MYAKHNRRTGSLRIFFVAKAFVIKVAEPSIIRGFIAPFRVCALTTLKFNRVWFNEREERFLGKVLETQEALVNFYLSYDKLPSVSRSFIPVVLGLSRIEHGRLANLAILSHIHRPEKVQFELALCSLVFPRFQKLQTLQLGFNCLVSEEETVPNLKSAFCRLHDDRKIAVQTYPGWDDRSINRVLLEKVDIA